MRKHTLTPRFSEVSWQEQRTRGDNQTDGLRPLYSLYNQAIKPVHHVADMDGRGDAIR